MFLSIEIAHLFVSLLRCSGTVAAIVSFSIRYGYKIIRKFSITILIGLLILSICEVPLLLDINNRYGSSFKVDYVKDIICHSLNMLLILMLILISVFKLFSLKITDCFLIYRLFHSRSKTNFIFQSDDFIRHYPQNIHLGLRINFKIYQLRGKNQKIRYSRYHPSNYISKDTQWNEFTSNTAFQSGAMIKFQPSGRFQRSMKNFTRTFMKSIHVEECRKKKLIHTMNECQWKKLELELDLEIIRTTNNVEDKTDYINLLFMNKLGYTFLTSTNYENLPNFTLIEYLQMQTNFNVLFENLYVFMIESLIVREDGLQLIKQLITKLHDTWHQETIESHISDKLFKQWPLPLWYSCLLKIRQSLRRGKKVKYIELAPFSIKNLILNPMESGRLFHILNLKYINNFSNEKLKYGLFESLNIQEFILNKCSNKISDIPV